MILTSSFFDRDAREVARDLLGQVIRRNMPDTGWLAARIIETEAYFLDEKGSHASLGYTEKRKALFMKPGTVYMYYARGKDSFNISCRGCGNAVLIKSAFPYEDEHTTPDMVSTMQVFNPPANGQGMRSREKLCAGQTLLCAALNLTVKEWDQQSFHKHRLYIDDTGYRPETIIQTRRLGIPPGRDQHLPLRYVDEKYARFCTSNPLTKRKWKEGQDYTLISPEQPWR